MAKINLPQYWQDPMVGKTQQQLYDVGGGLLKGDIPEFYKDIAKPGGTAFDAMLAGVKKDVSKGVYEDIARRGGRGGLATSVIGRTMGDIGTKLRWEDLLRTTEGKKFLFGAGADITAGVRGAGLQVGAGRRAFDISKAGLEIGQEEFGETLEFGKEKFGQQMELEKQKLALAKKQIEDQKKAQKSQMWSNILSSAIGAAGTVAGFAIGGPFGAGIGGKLGSAAASSIMPEGGLKLSGLLPKGPFNF